RQLDLDRGAAAAGAAVTQLAGDADAPGVDAAGAGLRVAVGAGRGDRVNLHAVRELHADGLVGLAGAAVAELAHPVVAPGQHRALGEQRDGERAAAEQLGDRARARAAEQEDDPQRRRLLQRRRHAELAVLVVAPGVHAVAGERERGIAAGRDAGRD